jgi:hypothetical protein
MPSEVMAEPHRARKRHPVRARWRARAQPDKLLK